MVFESIKKIASKITWTHITIAGVAVLLSIVAYYIYNKKVSSLSKPSYHTNSELNSTDRTGKEAELLFFYATWCPHCKTSKPIWSEFVKEHEGKIVNGYKLIFTEVDCTTESPDVEKMINTYKIEGFPTIKLLKDEQIIEFDAKPTKSSLEQFINSVL
jgi:thiol-disulfide isomerase/thioredoxin